MKLNQSISLAIGLGIAAFISFYACKNKASKTTNETKPVSISLDGSGEVYIVDTIQSVIEWEGATPGGYKHNGTIQLSRGQFTVKDNQLTSGKFIININSIANLDQKGKDKTNLEGHLKEKDFFEAEKFPIGSFEITEIKKDSAEYKVTGNLTLKQVTNSIQIPVQLRIDSNFVYAETSVFAIDRTKWGIVYNSGVIGTIKDDLINDAISLKLKIVAEKTNSKK
jgi:polyisoprenoid-binding protein YceI